MTKRQANLIIALLTALIGLQAIFGAAMLRSSYLTRKEAEAAQVSSMDTLEMQKRAEQQTTVNAQSLTIQPAPGTAELKQLRLEKEALSAELDKTRHDLQRTQDETERVSLKLLDYQAAAAIDRQK